MSFFKGIKLQKQPKKQTKSLSDFVVQSDSRELKRVVKKAVKLSNEDQRKLMGRAAN